MFNPTNNSGIFKSGKETGVATKPFPTDLSALSSAATNKASTQSLELYVQLKPGASSGDNNGYALVSTGGFMGAGGTKVDSILLSGSADNVIYSSQNIHVKGTLNGRLSIASNNNLYIEGNTVYEAPPDVYDTDPGLSLTPPSLTLAQNQTTDMLGLIAQNNVIIPSSIQSDISINGAIFAQNGSFEADNWNVSHSGTWRINAIGSITQQTRGAVGQTTGSGFKKSYRFDPQFDQNFSLDPSKHPPAFPGYLQPSTLKIANWWESPRVPLDVTQYY